MYATSASTAGGGEINGQNFGSSKVINRGGCGTSWGGGGVSDWLAAVRWEAAAIYWAAIIERGLGEFDIGFP